MKRMLMLLLFIALPLASQATMVYLEAPDRVTVGTPFEVSFFGDFEDFGLHGAGMDFVYDEARAEVTDFHSAIPNDPDFSCPGAPLCPPNPPGLFVIILASFFDPMILPDAGVTLLATMSMVAGPTPGVLRLDIIDNTPFSGGWFDANFDPMPIPSLMGTRVRVVAVDIPSTGLLLLLGVGAHFCVRRRAR